MHKEEKDAILKSGEITFLLNTTSIQIGRLILETFLNFHFLYKKDFFQKVNTKLYNGVLEYKKISDKEMLALHKELFAINLTLYIIPTYTKK